MESHRKKRSAPIPRFGSCWKLIASLWLSSLLFWPWALVAEQPARPGLDSLAWLAGGQWAGEGLGGWVEESWSEAAGGTLLGTFRISTETTTQVIEFMLISEVEEGVVYRFKHFRADYSTWEEDQPLTFDLISAGKGEAVFESSVQDNPKRLIYRLTEDGALAVTVEGLENGKTSSFEVVMQRVGR